ncbi:Scr1 family TA system antitoxin-like transcriptional regulator [Streptomyces leeuwenhoekii]|uniref:Scr1 family TA system antitoxin-like transcriptional regulator n=2 Tax=Streptomyces leeuwenhoekii TaxID=1437453 RepID=UPI0027953567|nr:Scr1 family TA system antitoxin-like transcriptional regulator [Streptomyces leeuwenhoekii]
MGSLSPGRTGPRCFPRRRDPVTRGSLRPAQAAAEIHLGPYRLPGTAPFPWLDGQPARQAGHQPQATARFRLGIPWSVGPGRRQAWNSTVSSSIRAASRKKAGYRVSATYAVLAVPDLLQTEEYARTMFTVWRPRRREDEIEEMVAARLARHRIYERKPAPTLSFVIEKSVLERPFGGVDVLRGWSTSSCGHRRCPLPNPCVTSRSCCKESYEHRAVPGTVAPLVQVQLQRWRRW